MAIRAFTPIIGRTYDDDLTQIKDAITPILIAIPYDSVNTVHNLWGIIATFLEYIQQYTTAFPIPIQPSAYPEIEDTATNFVRAWEKAKNRVLIED